MWDLDPLPVISFLGGILLTLRGPLPEWSRGCRSEGTGRTSWWIRPVGPAAWRRCVPRWRCNARSCGRTGSGRPAHSQSILLGLKTVAMFILFCWSNTINCLSWFAFRRRLGLFVVHYFPNNTCCIGRVSCDRSFSRFGKSNRETWT